MVQFARRASHGRIIGQGLGSELNPAVPRGRLRRKECPKDKWAVWGAQLARIIGPGIEVAGQRDRRMRGL